MSSITESYVDSLAPNAGAMKNGRDLVKKNSFPSLHKSEDGTLLFGECKGSGKEPYRCSVDFANDGAPTFRCTCPSRQFPCKHGLGLLYAYALGQTFVTADIPSDVAEKRERAGKREEKKKEAAAAAADGEDAKKPRKVNQAALAKKIGAQLEGLALLDKLVRQLVQNGLGGADKRTLRLIEEQAKELGNYYIPGVQAALRELILILDAGEDRESAYSAAIEKLIYLRALAKRARVYLEGRTADPALPMDSDTALEEQIGHAWQLAELKAYGRAISGAELLQLAFFSYADQARGEFVDVGWWAELGSGTVRTTRHLRPFRAAKSMKEEDSVFAVAQADELYVYPGETNARVRWEQGRYRDIEARDLQSVRAAAAASFPDVVKQVKNALKGPLANKNPAMLIAYAQIRKIGETYVFVDGQGKQLRIADDAIKTPHPATSLLPLLGEDELRGQAALVLFRHGLDSGLLEVQPLSLITERRIVRLLF